MKKHFQRIKLFSCLLLMLISIFMPLEVSAYNNNRFYSSNDILFYDENDNGCSSSSTGSNSSSGGSWNSGLQPPYILEQFAIETLKNIAAKKGIDPSNAVTEEHAIALVAFMLGEGGDINNQDIFNPLNTGIDAPDLVDGQHADGGTQSFKSFDAGIEGTARTMVGAYQSRLGYILTQKSSTAKDFMYALTYYNEYDGNEFWASASKNNPDDYYNQRLSLVAQTRSNYEETAGLVLGTDEKEQQKGIYAQEKLVYHPSGSGPSSGTGGSQSDSCGESSSGDATPPDNVDILNTGGWTLKENTDYSNVQCASGSTFQQKYKHPTAGFTINICEIPGLGVPVASLISQKTINMLAAAERDKVTLTGSSGFRTYDSQVVECNKDPSCSAGDYTHVAKPGGSQHERGIAIDFNGIDEVPGTEPEWLWLKKHGAEYGFLNYPAEGWHWSMMGY